MWPKNVQILEYQPAPNIFPWANEFAKGEISWNLFDPPYQNFRKKIPCYIFIVKTWNETRGGLSFEKEDETENAKIEKYNRRLISYFYVDNFTIHI